MTNRTDAIKKVLENQILDDKLVTGELVHTYSEYDCGLILVFSDGRFAVFEHDSWAGARMSISERPPDDGTLLGAGLISQTMYLDAYEACQTEYKNEREANEKRKLAELIGKYGIPK